MTWFSRKSLTTTLAAGVCLGILTSSMTITQPALQTPVYAAPDTGGLDLGGAASSLLRADTRQLAPGLKATSFDRLQAEGWVTGDVIIADLRTPSLTMDVRDSGSLTRPAPVTEHTIGDHAVVAINGSFFDINNSGVAQGTNISSSEGLKTTSPAPTQALTIAAGLAAIQALSSAATVDVAGESHAVGGVNSISIPANGIGYFTQMWGEHPIARGIGGPANVDPTFLRVEVADGIVVRKSSDLDEITGPTSIAPGTGVLLARGTAVDLFADIEPGDALPVNVAASQDVDLAIAGNQRLVADGAVVAAAGAGEPRTAAGVSADGSTIYIVSIDGRQSHSRGMALDELGEFMVELGAHNAVNLDGGGSSTFLLREPGSNQLSIGNAPSDGNLRSVPNSLVFSSTAPSTGIADVMVKPAIEAEDADAVFPGLSRTISGIGLDANRAATPATGEFSVTGGRATLTAIDGETARVTGERAGRATVSFMADGKTASSELRVLGELEQLRASQSVIALPDGATTATVKISGVDRDGFSAPIEAADLTTAAGTDVLVEATGTDSFTITPQVDSGAATVSFSAGKHRVDVAVTIGLDEKLVSDLENASDWKFVSDRATGTVTPATGPNGEAALKLSYDFASSTGTRGAYAVAPEPIEVPGQPQALTMWLHGDGNTTWPRLQMKTGTGTTINLDAPHTSWTGWQQVRFTVPTGTAFPLKLERVRMMETSAAKQYQGETMFAGLQAIVAPDVDQPKQTVVHDPLVITNGTVDDRAQRIAVMSDAQFVARSPEGANAQGARETLREILAAEPEMFVINGDFVDEAAPEDFDLARRILDEEIGDKLPWVYLPGNHEVMGGPIQNFIDEFGPTKTKQQVGSTLIVTLNTANGSFNRSDTTQMRFLEDALKDAEQDSTVTGVLVFAHHPADDPKSSKDSQISDRLEARKYQERLAEFRADTGKSIASMNAHAGVFHATSYEGVSTLLTGNSGKSPSSTPDQGGFTGWAMLGINPGAGSIGFDPQPVSSRTNWLQAEVLPRVDEVTLGATAALPEAMTVGDTLTIDATISQDNGRVVPVQWPMSAEWNGSGLVVDDGSADPADPAASERDMSLSAAETTAAGVLRLNPATGELTATGAGIGTVSLTVNGETVTHEVSVAAAPTDPNLPTDPTPPAEPSQPTEPSQPAGPSQPGSSAEQGGQAPGTGDALAETGGDELQPWLAGAFGAALLAVGSMFVAGRRKRA